MGEARTVTIPLNGSACAVLMWLTSVTLMTLETILSPEGNLGRWALLIGIAAGCWTIARLLTYHRRVVIEVTRFELRQALGQLDPDEEVTPMRGRRPAAKPGRTTVD